MKAVPLAVAVVVGTAGCSDECVPDVGLGPSVRWVAQSPSASSGEPVMLKVTLSALDVVTGTPGDHGKCEGTYEPIQGTAQITPAGGTPITETVLTGSYTVTIPYASTIGFRFDALDGETYREDWKLPAVFEVATSVVGTSLHVTWTTPEPLPPDAQPPELDITLATAGASTVNMFVPDNGSADVELSRLPAGAGSRYNVSLTRIHPAVPSVRLEIVTTFIRP